MTDVSTGPEAVAGEVVDDAADAAVDAVVADLLVPAVDSPTEDFAQQIADAAEAFLVSVQAISREAEGSRAIALMLLEVSQILLAGARLAAQQDFTPVEEYQPDVGPDPDLDEMRLRLARIFGPVDEYTFNFDPYDPELVTGTLSDDLTSIANQVALGLRHYRNGDVSEALWWWQFSYVSSWANEASAVLRALQSVVTHARLDAEFTGEEEELAAANEMLEGEDPISQ